MTTNFSLKPSYYETLDFHTHLGMTGESTLRADAQLLQCFFSGTPFPTFGQMIRRSVDPVDHLPLVFELGEFGRDDTEDDGLPLGQKGQGFEPSRTGRVVFQVKGVSRERREERLGDLVVRARTEMTGSHIITPTEMNAEVHISRALSRRRAQSGKVSNSDNVGGSAEGDLP